MRALVAPALDAHTAGRASRVPAVHPPRPPALNPAVVSALWGIGLGAFIWIGLISVEIVSRLASLVFGIVGGVMIFFFVLLMGAGRPPARDQPAKQ
jgi:hypothetical protein